MERVLGVDFFLVDVADDFVQQGAILQHQQVRVEDAAFIGAHADTDLTLHIEDLLPSQNEGAFKAADFLGQVGVGHVALGNGGVGTAQDDDFSPANPCRNRNATENLLTFWGRVWHERALHVTPAFEKSFFSKPFCQTVSATSLNVLGPRIFPGLAPGHGQGNGLRQMIC